MAVQDSSPGSAFTQEEVCRQLLYACHDVAFALALTDSNGIITYVNRAFSTLTGYDETEAIGSGIDPLCFGACGPELREEIRLANESGVTWSGRLDIRRRDGSQYRSRSIFAPVYGADGQKTGNSFFSRDTSDETKLEAQLGHIQKMEAIGELAAGIAHEINTPIQYIGDNLQFIKEGIAGLLKLVDAADHACQSAAMGQAAAVADNLARLRDEIDLDFLREELPLAIDQAMEGRDRVAAIVRAMKEFAHPGDEEFTPVDVNHVIENALAVSRGEWKHVADVDTDLDPAMPHVPCYPGSFNQVLLNLIVNAAHAIGSAREGGRGDRGSIRITTRVRGDWACIGIRDSGCGIPKENLHRIFEPFFTTKDVGKGTGQGLALAHAVIVDRMRGRIDVESEPGIGTEFTLYLPLESPAVDPQGAS